MSDLSVYAGEQFVDWLSQGTINSAPSNIYVTVFDDTGTELDGDFATARASTSAGTDWTDNGTDFENTSQISLGEATTDVSNIDDVALYDSSTGGNELARYQMTDSLFDVSSGTELLFEAGDLTFDVKDRTQ